MAGTDRYDLVVIGGGTSGIVAARFYLDVHPEAKVAIIERDNVVGGVWSSGQSRTIFQCLTIATISLTSPRTSIPRLQIARRRSDGRLFRYAA